LRKIKPFKKNHVITTEQSIEMNDLEKFGPNLSRSTRNNPFIVPNGYFDTLPSRVQDYCQRENAKNQPVKWVVALKTQLALAAGFVFLVFLALAGYYFLKPFNNSIYFDRVDYVKIVVESGTEFDERQLYEAVTNGNKKDSVKTNNNEELIEYLLFDNVDYNSIMELTKDIKP